MKQISRMIKNKRIKKIKLFITKTIYVKLSANIVKKISSYPIVVMNKGHTQQIETASEIILHNINVLW